MRRSGQKWPDMHERQAQTVDPDVVVFPMGARLLEVTVISLAAIIAATDIAVAVDQVGFAPQGAFPFAGLLQQMPPRDGAVVVALKAAVVDQTGDGSVEIGQEPAIEGDPGDRGHDALGDREGHVGAVNITPRRDKPAVPNDQTRRPAARPGRADDRTVLAVHEPAVFQMLADIAGPRRFMGFGIGDGLAQLVGIETRTGRINGLKRSQRADLRTFPSTASIRPPRSTNFGAGGEHPDRSGR